MGSTSTICLGLRRCCLSPVRRPPDPMVAAPLTLGSLGRRAPAPAPPGAGAGVLIIGSSPLWLYCRRDFLVNTTDHLGSRNFHSLTASATAWCLPWSRSTMTPTELQLVMSSYTTGFNCDGDDRRCNMYVLTLKKTCMFLTCPCGKISWYSC